MSTVVPERIVAGNREAFAVGADTGERRAVTTEDLAVVSFETDDAAALRTYLANKGVSVPASIEPDPERNLSFIVKDPEGQDVQFIQFTPGSVHARNAGRFLSTRRLSGEGVDVTERATHQLGKRSSESDFYSGRLPCGESHIGQRHALLLVALRA